jgi:hypothetical protein
MDLKDITLDEAAFLNEPATLELSNGKPVEIPRWTARKALKIGAKLASAFAKEQANSANDADSREKTGYSKFLKVVLSLAGEIVCETLGESDEFLDTITKEDLASILIAIVKQEFINSAWRNTIKKAIALLPPAR